MSTQHAERVDWAQDICTDTSPPRRAKVVEIDLDDRDFPFRVATDWQDSGVVAPRWVTAIGVPCYGGGQPRIRNVRAGDFPDDAPAPDLAAMGGQGSAA